MKLVPLISVIALGATAAIVLNFSSCGTSDSTTTPTATETSGTTGGTTAIKAGSLAVDLSCGGKSCVGTEGQ